MRNKKARERRKEKALLAKIANQPDIYISPEDARLKDAYLKPIMWNKNKFIKNKENKGT